VTGDGRLKILDFGLAKVQLPITASVTTADSIETQTIAGTFCYMAPAQRPFVEMEPTRLIGAILHRAPQPLTALNPGLSLELERIVGKCLEKEPENRYQSVKELVVDLRRLSAPSARVSVQAAELKRSRVPVRAAVAGLAALVGVSLLLVAFNACGWRDRFLGRATTPKINSLAVLPLANLSGDPQQEYFADGMTEELITEPSQISALKVTSRTSVLRYKGLQKSVLEIARELQVDALVEGSVLRSGDRVRISAQLIRASTDQHIWAQSYDRDLRDVLSLHSEVARAIAQQIRVSLTPGEQDRLGGVRPVVPESHTKPIFVADIYAIKFTREPLLRAVDYLQQAVDKDPTYAPAYAELAHVYFQLAIASSPEQSLSSSAAAREMLPRARAAAQKAVELDPTLAPHYAWYGEDICRFPCL
jgi:TolB-like protein